MVGLIGGIIEQEETIGESSHQMCFCVFQIVAALWVEQREAIEILSQLVLLIVPLADLLIGPLPYLLA